MATIYTFGRRTFPKSALNSVAAGAAFSGLPAPHVWAQAAQVPVRFTLNLPRNGTNSPFIHAMERGYYQQEGIRIVSMDPAAGADAKQRVASDTARPPPPSRRGKAPESRGRPTSSAARSSAQRAKAIAPWIDAYNATCVHSALGHPPLLRPNNLLGNDI